MYRNGIKRLLAVILSLCGMIVLSPLLLILCLAIKIDSPGPIFFRQKRVGIHKQHFNILKFRTMRAAQPCARRSPSSPRTASRRRCPTATRSS